MPTARLRLIAAAALFSTGGAAIKAASLTGWQVAGLRSAVAALVVWLLVPAARGRWGWRVIAVAALYAATMVGFVLANKLTTAANATFLQATAPLYVLLGGPLLLGEHASRRDVVFMGVIAAGMALCFLDAAPPQATAPRPALGNALGALCGVLWAGTVLGLRWLGAREGQGGAVRTVVAGNVLAGVACAPMALPLVDPSATDWLVVLYLGAVQIGLAYSLFTTAIPHVPALEASTLLLVEPALAPLWALLVHGERPGALSWAGGAIILAGAAAKTRWEARAASVRGAPA